MLTTVSACPPDMPLGGFAGGAGNQLEGFETLQTSGTTRLRGGSLPGWGQSPR